MFICKRCQFSAATRALLKKHLKKKTPCRPSNCHTGDVPTVDELIRQLEEYETAEILPYGEEDMTAIPDFFIRSCFMKLEFGTIFENLHKDPDFPCNNNIKLIKTGRKKHIEVYKDSQAKWVTTDYDEQLNNIIMRIHGIFDEYQKYNFEKVLEDMTEEEWMEIQKELEEIKDTTTERYNKAKEEIVDILVLHKQ